MTAAEPRNTGGWCLACDYCHEFLSKDGVTAEPTLAVSVYAELAGVVGGANS